MLSFEQKLKEIKRYPLTSDQIEILQVNIGKKCNLCCNHCHVEAGPDRSEQMKRETFEKCLKIVKKYPQISTIDITGGSPEMNENLEWFLSEVSKSGRRVIVRSNLVILLDPKYKKFIDIYSENKVEIAASLPCYLEENVDSQRGKRTYDKIIKVIRMLNEKGYGKEGSGLILDFVYNPVGAYLPGAQGQLEKDYKNNLKEKYGIVFNHLFCITNIPMGKFLLDLKKSESYEGYMKELSGAFNPKAVLGVMCRSTVSVGYDGKIYDCDFHQMSNLPIAGFSIDNFDYDKLSKREIILKDYCFGCTAGAGSSCQGEIGGN
ncbi:MAG: arsenosugar biosynthesis radical SAM protein ArsS [Candidatus Saganbacteria bacterium]|nr:arsenosugar biosynthesis radical SAM protein ArsS [Candidatus Saganbacteria bacterium]